MNDDFAINKRIQQVIKDKHLTNATFAEAIGVNRSSISQLLSERNKPSLDFLEKMLRTYKDLDANWLLRGELSSFSVREAVQTELFPDDSVTDSVVQPVENSNLLVNEPSKNRLISSESTTSEKIIEKIVTFYSDKTFEVYKPM